MKKTFIANWKENKNYEEASSFFGDFLRRIGENGLFDKEIILCPPAIFLPFLWERLRLEKRIRLGAQDISVFEGGSFTGEISVRMVVDFVGYCLVGHSDRRSKFLETSEIVNRKIELCQKYNLTPIICVSSEDELKEVEVTNKKTPVFLSFEPQDFIGGDETEDRRRIEDFYELSTKIISGDEVKFIYGGSVTRRSIGNLIHLPFIHGFLIGHESLDPNVFADVVLS